MSTSTTKHMVNALARPRMTVDEFEQMVDSLGEERFELIDGQLSARGEMKPPHVLAMDLAAKAVGPLLPSDRFIRDDKPVRIPDFNEPFPDLAVARGNSRVYATDHPGPDDISLLIELSDTTLAKDRGEKQENYARARIPVYWIVNLVDRQIEVYTEPQADGYSQLRVHKPGEDMPVIIDDKEIGRVAVADVLP